MSDPLPTQHHHQSRTTKDPTAGETAENVTGDTGSRSATASSAADTSAGDKTSADNTAAHKTAPRSRRSMGMVPWVVASGMFINQLDSTVLTTSLPQIAVSLNESPLKLSLAITSYLITLAVFIPISGWIADRFGPRRVFCWAIAIFTLSSAACGFADDLW